ncbi:unnamed protein product [Orchesella dallaii]|uniref:Ionotropic glutamate receptor C-terminal domain-containing protein n=1 Tax=Orchesella dallaii TaxID=48710 RepID=A0ABP1RMN8_9HEXA
MENEAATWTHTQEILLDHFQEATVNFVWEKGNLASITSVFLQCIIIHCALLSFDWSKLRKKIRASREKTYEHILKGSTRAKPGFSSPDLLLVSNSKFPAASKWKNHALQIAIKERELEHPLKIPSAVLLFTNFSELEKSDGVSRAVTSLFSTSLLIFVDSFNNSAVKIGCFACGSSFTMMLHPKYVQAYSLTFQKVSNKSIQSFETLILFWQKIHSTINFDSVPPNWTCLKKSQRNDICQIFKTYCQYKNCSEVEKFTYFHIGIVGVYLTSTSTFHFLRQIYPFGPQITEYKLQIIFPKMQFLDSNLSAFLTPFAGTIWLYILIAIAVVSIWVKVIEKGKAFQVIYWQISVLLEQDAEWKTRTRKSGKLIITIWIISLYFLREFYNSSLYSMMAAEKEPNDYPLDINATLNRNDFDIILLQSIQSEIHNVLYPSYKKSPTPLELLWKNILKKSYTIRVYGNTSYIQTLQAASSGNYTPINYCSPGALSDPQYPIFECVTKERKFPKFGIMCEGNCEGYYSVVLSEKQNMHRKIQQKPFFKNIKLWSHGLFNFATLSFPKFLGSFVQSGLYEVIMKRHRMLKHLKEMQNLNQKGEMGMSNGSLFSYMLLANSSRFGNFDEEATKLTAFTGTILICSLILGAALIALGAELYQFLRII